MPWWIVSWDFVFISAHLISLFNADGNKGFTLGFYKDGSEIFLYKSSKPETTVHAPVSTQQIIKQTSTLAEMALKTQLGLTFTNGKLTDIHFCNIDGCGSKFERTDLERLNFSLSHYNEPMEMRVMAKNTGNFGAFKLFNIAVYNRDSCQGLFYLSQLPIEK